MSLVTCNSNVSFAAAEESQLSALSTHQRQQQCLGKLDTKVIQFTSAISQAHLACHALSASLSPLTPHPNKFLSENSLSPCRLPEPH